MKKISVLICFLLISTQLFSQWNVLSDYDSMKRTYCLHFYNSNLGFVGGENGIIWKTIDGGSNWNRMQIDSCTFFNVKFISESSGYVCGTNGRLYRTTDGGLNWLICNSGINDTLRSLCFIDNNTGWCAGRYTIIKTTNAGLNWSRQSIDTSAINPSLFIIKMFDSQFGFAGGCNWTRDLNNGYLYKTTNGGLNWYLNAILARYLLCDIFFLSDTNIYVSTGNMIFRSTNTGINWNFIDSGYAGIFRSIYFLDTNNAYYCGGHYLMRTSNGGRNWNYVKQISGGLLKGFGYFAQNGIYLLSDEGEIIKSNNYGSTWGNYSVMSYQYIQNLYPLNVNEIIETGSDGTLRKSTDSGFSWKQKYHSSQSALRGVSFVDNNTGFCSTNENYSNFVLKTSDAGENWFRIGDTIPEISSLFAENTDNLWGCGYGGKVIRSTNSGLNWSCTIPDSTWTLYGIIASGPVVKVLSYEKFWISTNYGLNWSSSIDDTLGPMPSPSPYFKNASTGWIFRETNSDAFFKTTDGGFNWSKHYFNRPVGDPMLGITFVNDLTGFSAAYQSVLKTTDGGFNWSVSQTFPLGTTIIWVKFANENTGWISGLSGFFARTTNGGSTFISAVGNLIPDKFELFQNYPNPFNVSTVIKFSLKNKSSTSLVVYDMLGREIKSLVNDVLNPGSYSVFLNMSDFASGIYFYRLKTENYSESKRMVYLK